MRANHVPWLVAALAAVVLNGCGRSDQTQRPPQPSTSPPPAATATQSVSQTAQAGGANAAETAKGTDEPMKSMSKDEESKAMPQPGQANDHSTVGKDPKDGNN